MNDDSELARARAYYKHVSANASLDTLEEAHRAFRQLLDAERAAAIRQGLEAAVPLEWPVPWQMLPEATFCFQKRSLEMTYLVHQSTTRASAIFVECEAAKIIRLSDEAIENHPLYGCGLTVGAFEVMNSRWVKELSTLLPRSGMSSPYDWTRYRHYLLVLKECVLEAVAQNIDFRGRD